MELIACLYDLNSFEKIKPYCEGVVVYSSDFSSFHMNGFDKDEILNLIKINNNDKKIFIDIEFMLEDYEIDKITDFILAFKEKNVFFIYSDLGIHQILKENQMECFGIYNPNTLITNSFDLNFYLSQNMHAACLSLEITVDDEMKILDEKCGNVMMQVFGYHLMFHSKRHLISLYEDFLGKKIDRDNYNSFLIEQTRKDKYHIYESNRGTSLFRPYVISYLDCFEKLSKLDYALIDNMFIELDTYLEVLKIFNEAVNDSTRIKRLLEEQMKLGLPMEDGFKYQDTVYQKEELICKEK